MRDSKSLKLRSARQLAFLVVLTLALVLTLPSVMTGAAEESAEPALAETAAGRVFTDWLAALETGDEEVLRPFVNERFSPSMLEMLPPEELLGMHLGLKAHTGGLTVHSVRRSSESMVLVLCRSADGGWLLISLAVTPGPPHLITDLMVEPGEAPEILDTEPAADDEQLADDLETFIDTLADEDRFSGTVLIARAGKPIFTAVRGEASKRFDVPNRLDTPFNLGSMNKMFTAVAIAQLVEQKKLAYQDVVGRHLPDYPNAAVREKVTIHHLLSHTSGMGSHFTEDFRNGSKLRFRTTEEVVALFVDEELAFEPGRRMRYSNAGYFVLAMIIEKVSGQSYEEYVDEHISGPAGMKKTGLFEMDVPTPDLAIGYTHFGADDGEWRNNLYLMPIKGGPAGGGYSTVEDLNRFARALLDGTLVSPDGLELLTSPHGEVETRGDGTTGAYGYGFSLQTDVDGARCFGHSGGFAGISANLDICPDAAYTIAVLSNYDMGAGPVVDHIHRLLPRGAPVTGEASVPDQP